MISDWSPLDTSHEVRGWKMTAKDMENCKKKTQNEKNEIYLVFSFN